MRFSRKPIKEVRRNIIAYDLETTNIKEGTPNVLYFTLAASDQRISQPLRDLDELGDVIVNRLLTAEYSGSYFVAWNANNFDAYFMVLALLKYQETNGNNYLINPMLTRSKSLRGFIVKDDHKQSWKFYDGMAMTGAQGVSLQKFVTTFAPHLPKLKSIDWKKESFDPTNKRHVRYAERDSDALYAAMLRADEIVRGVVGHGLTSTIGNLGIKFFRSRLPLGTVILDTPPYYENAIRDSAFRGGYCWLQRQYVGKVWKYDLNQAYAAAMRDAHLPAGKGARVLEYVPELPAIYQVRFSRKTPTTPFYYKANKIGLFTNGAESTAWLTGEEYQQLCVEGWDTDILDGYAWDDRFNMADMVNDLETARYTDPDGPSGPLGTMVKYLGNTAYGKTAETLDGEEIVVAIEKPQGFSEYRPADADYGYFYSRINETRTHRDYHKPQIAAFITAHVRMVVRRAALVCADGFLYADTDCIVFDRPIDHLDIDPRRYGAWKVEVEGVPYILLGKKVYAGDDGTIHAKGLYNKDITRELFDSWLAGEPPEQDQLQKQSFVKVLAGSPMFIARKRRGTDFYKLTNIALSQGGEFLPRVID